MSAQQRGKTSEREMAVLLQAAAGRIRDKVLEKLVTVTGRVGHLTEWGFDILVGNGPVALCGEAKRRQKFLSADALRALLQIDRIAHEWEREPVLGFRLSDDVPTYHTEKVKNKKLRVRREWAVLPFSYAAELLAARRYLDEQGESGHFADWYAAELQAAEDARRRAPAEEVVD